MTVAPRTVFPLGPAFAGRRYAVLGLARSGIATVAALRAAGAEVLAWDDDVSRRDAAAALGATIGDPVTSELAGMAGVVVSPGVPLNRHPIAGVAEAAGVPVIGDIELFAEARAYLPPHNVVGITGTNGKSTTTALVQHILQTAGVPSLMGGNIGLPILAQAPLPAGGVYVLELSSYQIDLTFSLDCDVAVLLNVTPDHLDRYADFAAYRESKLRLFRMQGGGHRAIIASDNAEDYALVNSPSCAAHWVTASGNSPHSYPAQADWPALQGPHNAQNIFAAKAVAEALGIAHDTVVAGLRSYPGLPHRMERIATVGGVLFVNDSKATNPEAAAPALAAFTRIHWILGGVAKGATLGDCAAHYGNVVRAYLIGAAADDFARAIGDALPVEHCGTLDVAVAAAAARAQPGDVVLLAPAAASFDQFRDFEARGDAFRAAVAALGEGTQA